MSDTPRVSVGLPVYNGERYLALAIESILAQTFGDFELIIGDNASTDGTEEICRRFAAADKRIRYLRHPTNIGGGRNFNEVYYQGRAPYFRWAAHDDLHAPEYLARCVDALDADSSLVACHTHVRFIDAEGRAIHDHVYPPGHAAARDPASRFADLLREDRHSLEMFGLFRVSALRSTRLLGGYVASDRVLRAHLGLLGRFHVVPEPLFLNRDHPARCIRHARSRSPPDTSIGSKSPTRSKIVRR